MARMPTYEARREIGSGPTLTVNRDTSVEQALGNVANAAMNLDARLTAKREQREEWDRARQFENTVAGLKTQSDEIFKSAVPGDMEAATRVHKLWAEQTQSFIDAIKDPNVRAEYALSAARVTNRAADQYAAAQLKLDDSYFAAGIKEIGTKLTNSVYRKPEELSYAVAALDKIIDKSGLSAAQKVVVKTESLQQMREAQADGLVVTGRADEARRLAGDDAEMLNRIDGKQQTYANEQRVIHNRNSQEVQSEIQMAVANTPAGNPLPDIATRRNVNDLVARGVLRAEDAVTALGAIAAFEKQSGDLTAAREMFGGSQAQVMRGALAAGGGGPSRVAQAILQAAGAGGPNPSSPEHRKLADLAWKDMGFGDPVSDDKAAGAALDFVRKYKIVPKSMFYQFEGAVNSGDLRAAERAFDIASAMEDLNSADTVFADVPDGGKFADRLSRYQSLLDAGYPRVSATPDANGRVDPNAPPSAAAALMKEEQQSAVTKTLISSKAVKDAVKNFDAESAINEAVGVNQSWFFSDSAGVGITPEQMGAMQIMARTIYSNKLMESGMQPDLAAARTKLQLKRVLGVTEVGPRRVSPVPVEKVAPVYANPLVRDQLTNRLIDIVNTIHGGGTTYDKNRVALLADQKTLDDRRANRLPSYQILGKDDNGDWVPVLGRYQVANADIEADTRRANAVMNQLHQEAMAGQAGARAAWQREYDRQQEVRERTKGDILGPSFMGAMRPPESAAQEQRMNPPPESAPASTVAPTLNPPGAAGVRRQFQPAGAAAPEPAPRLQYTLPEGGQRKKEEVDAAMKRLKLTGKP